MANKSSTNVKSKMPEGKVSIIYVKKAGMWCKTWFEYSDKGTVTQKQAWSQEKPNE